MYGKGWWWWVYDTNLNSLCQTVAHFISKIYLHMPIHIQYTLVSASVDTIHILLTYRQNAKILQQYLVFCF